MPRHDVSETGFTLIELMIVVAIIGVLAVIAGTGYRKYADKARSSEVYAMFGEIRAKEEAYRAEFSAYCNTSAACATVALETAYHPVLLTANEPKSKLIGTPPAGWTSLGINPGKNALYCGYVAVAGQAAEFGTAGPKGAALWTGQPAPTAPWWYMRAACDGDGNPAVNVQFTSGMNTTAVVVENEGR